TAIAGDMQASIGFTPPGNTGGSPITGYTATCMPGSISAMGLVSPISVSGLTNSVLYSCSVTATGAGGTSAPSGTVGVTPTPMAVAPLITSANATSFTVNAAGTFTVTATGTPTPTLSLTGSLPAGVSFTPGTG